MIDNKTPLSKYFKRADGIPQIVQRHQTPELISTPTKPFRPYVPFSESKALIEKRDGYCFRMALSQINDLSDFVEDYPQDEEIIDSILLIEITPNHAGLVFVPLTMNFIDDVTKTALHTFSDMVHVQHYSKEKIDAYLDKNETMKKALKKQLIKFHASMQSRDFSFDILLLPPVFPTHGIETEIYRPANAIIHGLFATDFQNHYPIPKTPSRRLLDFLSNAICKNNLGEGGLRSTTSAIHELTKPVSDFKSRCKRRSSHSHPDRHLIQQIGSLKRTLYPS